MRLPLHLCACAALLISLAASLACSTAAAQSAPESVTIDARAPAQPFPHFWEQMFGSGRAVLSMRESYRRDLRQVKEITGFQYVRFHAILDDDIGVYGEDAQGRPVYNFTYVDQIYDGLLAVGVKPFVELSFMPKKLALRQDLHPFWYHPIVSPPADYAKWNALITAFTQHLVERYGIDEVATWYFEVWNEPNIDFWTGRPAQQTYFELYDNTARAVKAVNSRLRIGGPATAQAAWVDAMIAHAVSANVPLDFVSTHVYGNDTAENVFGGPAPQPIPPHQMVCAAVARVHAQIAASARPHMPLIWSEFNATYMSEPQITDSIYMGPWLANTISQCDGKVDIMSYWTFSDVFEEQGVIPRPFFGGFGLIAIDDIPKPSFDVFELLHGLGDQRIPNASTDVLVSKTRHGRLVFAAWNLVEPGVTAPAKTIRFNVKGVGASASVHIRRVDATHGDVLAANKKLGEPQFPTGRQIDELRNASKLPPPETRQLQNGTLEIEVPPQGLAVVEITP